MVVPVYLCSQHDVDLVRKDNIRGTAVPDNNAIIYPSDSHLKDSSG
jgi:hypothetical protein